VSGTPGGDPTPWPSARTPSPVAGAETGIETGIEQVLAAAGGSGGRGELLRRLMAVVRPQFRVEVFVPGPDDPVFYSGVCGLPSCQSAVRRIRRGLCEIHWRWWKQDGGPPLEQWIGEGEQRLVAQRAVPECAVSGCRRGTRRYQLCIRHQYQWMRADRPPMAQWLTTVSWTPTPTGERDCRYPGCARWTNGPTSQFCARHWCRWREAGRPDPDAWIAELPQRLDPRVDLRGLPPALRLEVQFGLQARHDERARITRIPAVISAVTQIRRAGVRSLLDWDDQQWRTHTRRANAAGCAFQSFILDTCYHLRQLLIDDPWTHEYPRQVWDLKALGLDRGGLRHLDFGQVNPGWLRELVKRWARWRLSRGLKPGTLHHAVRAVARLGEHLQRQAGPDAGPEALTRELLESWLAALVSVLPTGKTRKHAIGAVGGFLRAVEQHHWCEAIPRTARIYPEDFPKTAPPRHRWLSEHLMRQLEDPANLARFRTDEGRLLLIILIQCGLRLGDACKLPLDCVTRDRDHAPYLAWINHKIHQRAAFFPISTDLAALIAAQQHRQRARFPAGTPYLFTRYQANLGGQRPMHHTTWRKHLNQWLDEIDLVDEHGQRVRVTAHQFRHTLATRLLNRDVPAHVVQDLLDHMSPQMTARYAKLLDTTRRAHWEAAMKLNADAQPVTIPADHPLADAQWAKLSLVRAKVTLPNGYCGAPVQTDCEYANPCLDCRFFITTRDFLAQHRRQRDETRRLITDAQQAGLARVAEKNQRTAAKLDKLIDALEHTPNEQVVIGGRRDDDAAG
jgi:integrase